MYNTKFLLSDYGDLYPGYLDRDKRQQLRDQYGDNRGFMRCGCRPDSKLYYRISADLKIYPEHNNYQHDKNCSRYKNESGIQERKTGYVIDEEDGHVTTYLSFNPKNYELSSVSESRNPTDEAAEGGDNEIEEAVIGKEKAEDKKDLKKEPKLNLENLIRSINIDTYTEKVLNNKIITSKDLFSKNVFHRMKKVTVSRMKKAIGELTLETEGVRFIYTPVSGIVKNEDSGLMKCYIQNKGSDGRVFNNFIYPDTLEKAIKKFYKTYGTEPDNDTMLAGFQYCKKSKSGSGVVYKVLGRVHFFQTSVIGLYSRSNLERETFNIIHKICNDDSRLKFWIPPDDDTVGGIINVDGKKKKILILFRTKKSERITFDSSLYFPLVIGILEPLTINRVNDIIEKL